MLKLARKLAERWTEDGKYKVVAICENKQGRILSFATNSYKKSHPFQARLAGLVGQGAKIYLHAEIRAILRAREKPYRIFVARFGRDGSTKLAAPCPICQSAIKEAGIKLVEYTT